MSSEEDISKVKKAAFALATGWDNFKESHNEKYKTYLGEIRKNAIDVICQFGYSDDSVYKNLGKSYTINILSAAPDYDEIKKTLDALAAIKSDRAISMLTKYFMELHIKRCNTQWGNKEDIIYPWIVNSIGLTKYKTKNISYILGIILQTDKYTLQERQHAENVLNPKHNDTP